MDGSGGQGRKSQRKKRNEDKEGGGGGKPGSACSKAASGVTSRGRMLVEMATKKVTLKRKSSFATITVADSLDTEEGVVIFSNEERATKNVIDKKKLEEMATAVHKHCDEIKNKFKSKKQRIDEEASVDANPNSTTTKAGISQVDKTMHNRKGGTEPETLNKDQNIQSDIRNTNIPIVKNGNRPSRFVPKVIEEDVEEIAEGETDGKTFINEAKKQGIPIVYTPSDAKKTDPLILNLEEEDKTKKRTTTRDPTLKRSKDIAIHMFEEIPVADAITIQKSRPDPISDLPNLEKNKTKTKAQSTGQRIFERTKHRDASLFSLPMLEERDGFWNDTVDGLDTDLYEMLEDYFISVFTMLVYKIGLQPKDMFDIENTEEFLDIPVFCDEMSQQYVEECSKMMVHFIRKGVFEGAVLHVNKLNRDNCPITQQRFVFESRGIFCAEQFDVSDAARVRKATETAKTQLLSAIKELSDLQLKEVEHPIFSHWSISIAITSEFKDTLDEGGFDSPFVGCESADFFPWKQRPRLSQAIKLGLLHKIPKQSNGSVSPCVIRSIVKKHKKDTDTKTSTERFSHLKALKKKTETEFNSSTPATTPTTPTSTKLPQWQYFSSSSDSEDELSSEDSQNSTRTKLMEPITSQEVLPNLLILLYRLEYIDNIVEIDEDMRRVAQAVDSEGESV